MKKFLVLLFLLISFLSQAQQLKEYVQGLPRPNPPRLVNDFAGILTPEQKHALEQKLVAYNDSTSTQIAVVTVKTTGDLDIADVGLEILRQWGVGSQGKNNGIVITAAIDDRKIDIATGYGMEGAIPDAIAKNIIEDDIVPNFRQGDYYRGFDQATTSIFQAAAGEYKAPEGHADRGERSRGGVSIGKIIFILILLWIFFGRFGGGNRGGGFMSRRGYRRFGGGPIIIPGGFGGGGFGGGGFGGGGFGGFGGGSGGGGGASGSW